MYTVKYHLEAEKEANALPLKIKVKYDRIIQKLEKFPNYLREPDTKSLGNGLFELRTMGSEIARGLWVYHKGKTIIILRVFIKKSQKTPKSEFDLAKKRLQELLNDENA
ncbi:MULTISPECIES: type II toxin-antitoxin system RelE/ParE family toxin [Providencia]|uniref:type II toxin-antitoxin system RelE/ParE family toxin n=1 Tax=Providencia TaxID=586 RepID=UPI00055CCEE2|nr:MULTISPECIES: type II toxin-antitoxin system RelE/ParE family toxin [Providencia]MTC43092.1 type II toxin-antitoxin system RelE/ParE family toxin [Providencia sp. wls1921]